MTFLHDVTQDRCEAGWHQLTFATRGQLEVITEDARRFVPADRAVWVPAGVRHTSVMRARSPRRCHGRRGDAAGRSSTRVA